MIEPLKQTVALMLNGGYFCVINKSIKEEILLVLDIN